ncbi:hypothetical protein [Candidatus Pseudoscillospira sp. SGI.172]|uniref:hypothetical protein n=1 Tax=Candidatus Pseudoscillospira sp. SGI.172 TaxID=3420582 RepID=UPI003D088C8B
MKKRTALLAFLLALTLTGCFFRGADELYTVPRPSKDYEALQVRLSEFIAKGGEYAAPLSGELIQSVQLQDLDGDGIQEAIAFFRFPNEEKPMKICVFHQTDEGYETLTVIEGAGTAINCVEYAQMDDEPYQEIVVSWQMSDKVHSLAAYAIGPGQAEELLRTDYDSYRLSDLDQDGQQELVVFRTPPEGGPRAELYDYQGGLAMVGTAPLSGGITAVADGGVRAGNLMGRVPALFVVSAYEENGTITDIFTCQDGRLKNITLDTAIGESGETIRFYTQVTGSDINGDGIVELPQPVPLPDYKITTAAVNFWLIHWRQFDAQGVAHPVFTTYHNDRDGWYFILPEAWGDNVTLTRSDLPGGGERAVTFSYWEGDESVEPKPFLTIYKLTGSNRISRATMPGRFILFPEDGLEGASEANTIYAAEFRDGWDHSLSEREIRDRFSLIKTDWFAAG